jgi:hypothetical protein
MLNSCQQTAHDVGNRSGLFCICFTFSVRVLIGLRGKVFTSLVRVRGTNESSVLVESSGQDQAFQFGQIPLREHGPRIVRDVL